MSQKNGNGNGSFVHDTDPAPDRLQAIEGSLESIEDKLDRVLHLAEALSNEWNSLRQSAKDHESRLKRIESGLSMLPCTKGINLFGEMAEDLSELHCDEETGGGGV